MQTGAGDPMPVRPPAARPCGSCPYRRDVPSGVWSAHEYAKLPDYDQPTEAQPAALFLCHQGDGRICGGWAGTHHMDHNLALRLVSAAGHVSADTVAAVRAYRSDVPLFTSGLQAAQHGLTDVAAPTPAARTVITRLRAKQLQQPDTAPPVTDGEAPSRFAVLLSFTSSNVNADLVEPQRFHTRHAAAAHGEALARPAGARYTVVERLNGQWVTSWGDTAITALQRFTDDHDRWSE